MLYQGCEAHGQEWSWNCKGRELKLLWGEEKEGRREGGKSREASPIGYLTRWGCVTSGIWHSLLRMKKHLENIGSQNSAWWWYGPWLSVQTVLCPAPERLCSQVRSSWLVLRTSTGPEGTLDLPDTLYDTWAESVLNLWSTFSLNFSTYLKIPSSILPVKVLAVFSDIFCRGLAES